MQVLFPHRWNRTTTTLVNTDVTAQCRYHGGSGTVYLGLLQFNKRLLIAYVRKCRIHQGTAVISVTNSIPGSTSPLITSVIFPSLNPLVMVTGAS